jgi:hypothetical protein
MDMTPKDPTHGFRLFGSSRVQFPWVLAVVVFIAIYAVGYSLDGDRSQSERDGVVSQTEADNGVIPSLPPQ